MTRLNIAYAILVVGRRFADAGRTPDESLPVTYVHGGVPIAASLVTRHTIYCKLLGTGA